MLKIKKETSVYISLAAAILALVATIALILAFPFIVRHGLAQLNTICELRFAPTLIALYAAVVPVAAADIMLIRLLGHVRKSEVFGNSAVALLRGISWCCFAECIILLIEAFAVFAGFAPLICAAAFVAAFLGVVLRVVKNVIEEAAAIKSENDFTV